MNTFVFYNNNYISNPNAANAAKYVVKTDWSNNNATICEVVREATLVVSQLEGIATKGYRGASDNISGTAALTQLAIDLNLNLTLFTVNPVTGLIPEAGTDYQYILNTQS